MPWDERWAVESRDGTQIGVHRAGSGPPVLLVHGTLGDHRDWDRVREHLRERFALHALDRRGRGASGDADGYSLSLEVDDVAAAVEALAERAGRPPHLVGHSFGAILALEAALGTGAVDRLALYEPPIHGEDRPPAARADELDRMLAEDGREPVVEAFLREIGLTAAELARLHGTPAWERAVATAHTVPREARADLAYVPDPGRLARFQRPVLLLRGTESASLFHDAIDRLARQLPEGRLEPLAGAGHAAPYTASKRLADAIETFLLG